LASGKNKKAAVHATLQSPITTKIPASILQKHKNLTVILDEEACPPKFCRAKLGRAS